MASPAMAPRSERRSRLPRAVISAVVVAPVVIAAALLAHGGWRSDVHGAFLSHVHYAISRHQLQLLGFEYPPLPFLLLLPWPGDAGIIALGGLALFGLAWIVLDDCAEKASIVPLILLIAVLWTPIGLHLVAGDFNEAVGLFALYIGWRYYRRWWATRRTAYGLYTGLWLGFAFYTSPLGLAVALVAGAVLPLIFPRLQIPPFASQLVLLVFPGVAAAATWAYLSWIFTHHVAFPFTPWEPASPPLRTILAWTLPYLLVSLFALMRPRATTAGILLPLVLLVLATRIGWDFSLAFAAGFLTLVAIVALPRDLKAWQRTAVGALAAGQCVAAWLLVPWPRPTANDAVAHAVALAVAPAPDRSVLIDERWAPQLLKWAPSLAPYLTTQDTGFEIALADPAAKVEYLLVTPNATGLTLDADVHPPRGFVINWNWSGYTLYRRLDAPPLPVRYDAVLATTWGAP